MEDKIEVNENIRTDYQLYKFIDKKIGGVLSERKNCR